MSSSAEILVRPKIDVNPSIEAEGCALSPPQLSEQQAFAINRIESGFSSESEEWRRLCISVPRSFGEDEIRMVPALMYISTDFDKKSTSEGWQYRIWDEPSGDWQWQWTKVQLSSSYDQKRGESLLLSHITPVSDDGVIGDTFTLTTTHNMEFIRAGDPTYPPRVFERVSISGKDCPSVLDLLEALSDEEKRQKVENTKKLPEQLEQKYWNHQRAMGEVARNIMGHRALTSRSVARHALKQTDW